MVCIGVLCTFNSFIVEMPPSAAVRGVENFLTKMIECLVLENDEYGVEVGCLLSLFSLFLCFHIPPRIL